MCNFPSNNFPNVQFPKWQLPKCAISQEATSQMCNFPSGNFPKVRCNCPVRHRMLPWGRALWIEWSRGQSAAARTYWGWGRAMRLGQLPLGKIPPWEVATWEKFVGKVSNIKLNNPVNPVILVQYFLLYCWLSGHLRNIIFETHVTKPAGYLLQTKGKEGEGGPGEGGYSNF